MPEEVLTDNGKVFTARFGPRDAETLFDRICRENGITHTTRSFSSMEEAQLALDQYVGAYNALRPHQALGMAVPVERFSLAGPSPAPVTAALEGDVTDDAPRTEHVRRVDAGGKIWFAGARYYAGHGLRRDYVTVRIVDDEVRLYHRGALLRSHRRRHPKENEEVIYSHHREQTNRNVL